MRRPRGAAALLLAAGVAVAEPRDLAHPNILMVISDDLRPEIGLYGPNDTVHTPNLDKFGADPRTTVFTNAFVQQAVSWSRKIRL